VQSGEVSLGRDAPQGDLLYLDQQRRVRLNHSNGLDPSQATGAGSADLAKVVSAQAVDGRQGCHRWAVTRMEA
jgi:hypothetical protein